VKTVAAKKKRFTVALAGNPNCGKTSVFNALTGAKAHVGNYPGVTIEKRSARVLTDDLDIEYVDLPGVYSLSAITLDESAARNFILHEGPDLVINIIDAGNLERNLLLTTQLMEMGVRILLVLNMWDEAEKQGLSVNEEELSRRLRSPIVKTVGHRGIGMKQLRATVSKLRNDDRSRNRDHRAMRSCNFVQHFASALVCRQSSGRLSRAGGIRRPRTGGEGGYYVASGQVKTTY
jgi:ferrous iron transport protein B